MLGYFLALTMLILCSALALAGVIYSASVVLWGAEDGQAIWDFMAQRYIVWTVVAIACFIAGIIVTKDKEN